MQARLGPDLSGLIRVLGELADLVLPQRCTGCRAPRGPLCPACSRLLAREPAVVWPSPRPAGLPEPWAVAAYDGAVRAMIVAHKERARTTLTHALGGALAAAVRAAGGRVVVPVPSAGRAVRRRGHDSTLVLARSAVAELCAEGLDVRCLPALRQSRRTADQVGLGSAGRAANLAGALVSVLPVDGLRVVLVDDVITSGASLAEAARALRAAGAVPESAAVIAATTRR
ncbi:MAG: phosphoribosyltransferase family protein [Streptosporangiaceae bacterium]